MDWTRRTFVKHGAAAVSLAAFAPGSLVASAVRYAAAGHLALIGARDADWGGGAELGIEEAERAADLLRQTLRFSRVPVPPEHEIGPLLRALRADGVLGVVTGIEGPAQGRLERTASAEGIVVLDARAVRPDAAPPGSAAGAYRTGAPATAYALALAGFLARAEPERPWAVIEEAGAPPRVAAAARRAVSSRMVGWRKVAAPADEPEGAERAVQTASEAGAAAVLWLRSAAAPLSPEPIGAAALPVLAVDPAAVQAASFEGWHAALWTPSLFRYGAEQLNERYRRRFDQGMDGPAWAGWMAVKTLAEAVLRAGGQRGGLGERLAGPRIAFDGHKGAPLAFAEDGALAQPLYVSGPTGTEQVPWPFAEGTVDEV